MQLIDGGIEQAFHPGLLKQEFPDRWIAFDLQPALKRVFDLMKDFGTSKSTKIDSIFDSLLVPR
ncbi:MAG: hypothetical protein ABW095_14370, partial [Candidatus Thiodiazotropha sp.]